jgi:mono/diheme cytochrome c family protein
MRYAALLLCWVLAASGQSGPNSAQNVLETNCATCHGASQMSGLDVRQRDSMLKGGKRGPALVPGKPADSLIYKAVMRDGDLQMPPGKKALAPEDVARIKSWIEAGAPWESSKAASSESNWWAFRPLRNPPIPAVKNTAWARGPIDRFILAKLEEKSLHPVAAADRRTLIRRAYFDLHGLPPAPEEVEKFAGDTAPDAYEKLIDRLLASPRYGERWGRHWLDVVRYADSGGYETDVYYANAWRYRDYVIESFNSDKPYDQFVQEQIAADELWPDNLELNGSYDIPKEKRANLAKRIGTGLYGVGPMAVEYTFFGDQYRAEWQGDAVDTTGSAFLGLTMGCARCHDHKFDPITHKDYYSMAAIFAGSEDRELPIVSQMGIFEYTRYQTKLVIADQIKARINRLDAEARKRTPQAGRRAAAQLTPEEKDERETLLRQLGEAYMRAPMPYAKANMLVHSDAVPETHILVRGDFKQKGEKVEPGFLSAFGGGTVSGEPKEGPFVPQRRKALALWMTSKARPLLARVMVNRIWQGHFGRGIVGTPNDMGRQGEPPTHPELLDYLAKQFVDNRWSVKAMHRMIMLSSAYQLSSAPDDANSKVDADNQFVWKMNRRRLEAEAVRDNVLATAGTLNLKAGGPPIATPLTAEERDGMRDMSEWPISSDPADYVRRSVFLYVKRSFRLPMFETFDAPDASASCARRDSSTVAPQALALMNSEFMTRQAEQFAARLEKEHGKAPEPLVESGWRAAFGRPPSPDEKSKAVEFLAKSTLPRLCLLWFNMSEFLYVD